MGKNDIPTMSPKELRKLYKKLQKTWKKTLNLRWRLVRKLDKTDEALGKINALERRTRYWLGKAKALKCPAFKPCPKGSRAGMCYVHNPKWGQSYNSLFIYRCAYCTISPKQAKVKATWNGIFQTPQTNIP